MKNILALLLLAASLCGQIATLTLTDGRSVDAGIGIPSEIGNGRLEVWDLGSGWSRIVLRCTSEPAWRTNSWARPDFLLVRELRAVLPAGTAPKYWALREARQEAGGAWILLGPGMRTDAHDRCRDLVGTHAIEAGTAIAWTIGPDGAAYPAPKRPEVLERLRTARGMGPGKAPEDLSPHAYAGLARLRSLQTAGPASLDPKSIRRDLGWLLIHWHERFTGGRAPGSRGPYAWGSLLGADGHRSWSYDGILAAVEWYARSGDPWAWELACVAMDHKAHQSLYRGPDGHRAAGRWTYEKGANSYLGTDAIGRPTDYRFPEASHEWDAGPLAVALLSEDPEWMDTIQARRAGLLATTIPTVRNFGARLRGWYLWNLRHWYGLTGDPVFLARAQAVHDGCWATVKPGELWFSNDAATPGTKVVDPWQQALLLGEFYKWESLGLFLDPRFDAFAKETITKGSRIVATNYGPALRAYQSLNLSTGAIQDLDTSTAAFFLPILHRLRDQFPEHHAAAVTASCAMAFAARAWDLPLIVPERELQMDFSRGGSHGAKTLHQLLAVIEDRDLREPDE